eukprot:2839964-Amphidinium_carterae.3
MDQSVQSGLRLAVSWPDAHSLECPLGSDLCWVAHLVDYYSQTQLRPLAMAAVQSTTTRARPSAAPAPQSPTEEYSPVTAPPPETVESSLYSPADSQTNLSELTCQEALALLAVKEEATPQRAARFWAHDCMKEVTSLMAPAWQSLLHNHSMVHKLSTMQSDGASNGRMQKWLHSSIPTLTRMLEAEDLGS